MLCILCDQKVSHPLTRYQVLYRASILIDIYMSTVPSSITGSGTQKVWIPSMCGIDVGLRATVKQVLRQQKSWHVHGVCSHGCPQQSHGDERRADNAFMVDELRTNKPNKSSQTKWISEQTSGMMIRISIPLNCFDECSDEEQRE